MMPPTITDIEAAADRLVGHAVRTPLLEAPLLNQQMGGRLLIKAECLQLTGSFKFRGAYNKISQLDETSRQQGVVAFSSGNHAQGVAAAAHMLGTPAVIVMPEDAPAVKLESTKAWGAEVVTYPRHGADREAVAQDIADKRGLTMIPPFDDPQIIAGQGTVGLEIAQQTTELGARPDAIVVCCGGGGLTAGCATALHDRLPGVPVHTSEPEGWDDTARSLKAGSRQKVDVVTPSVCDALLAPIPGELTFAINRDLVDSGFTVSERDVGEAMALAHRYLKVVLEPGGAAALAAVTGGKTPLQGRTVVVVASGGECRRRALLRPHQSVRPMTQQTPPPPKTVRIGLHSFSFEHHFLHKPGFDAFEFIDRAVELGVAGVHISMNGQNFRCAGGTDPGRLAAIADAAADAGLFVETDTSGTSPDHLAQMARAARQIGADKLRTYTRHTGKPASIAAATTADLRNAAARIADEGVVLLLENHEEFTGAEVATILDDVAHPAVRALYDFGNSMNVVEDPMVAAQAMAAHIRSVHLKDHVLIEEEDGPQIVGVPNGTGTVDIQGILGFLLAHTPLNRVCVESSYGYCSRPIRNLDALPAAKDQIATFHPLKPPYDPGHILLDAAALRARDPAALFNYETAATARGVGHLRRVLGNLGFQPLLNSRGGVYQRGTNNLAFDERHR